MPRGRDNAKNGRRSEKRQGRGRVARGGRRGQGGLAGGRSPMPWDSQAQRESGALGNQAADARVDLGAQFGRAQRTMGFGTGADNPYSERAQSKRSYDANRRGITHSAGKQLYAGSTLNAQSAARGAYDRRLKSLEGDFAEAQTAHTRGIARTARDEALGQAGIKEGAIGRAAASEPQPLAVGRGRGRGRRSNNRRNRRRGRI